jgi:DNA repair photolyase
VHEERAKAIVTKNTSPDLPFGWSLNPYRGCYHACAYCYARTSHQWLGFGAGTDFDRKIVVKVNAVERLRATFERKSWAGDPICFSGNTDCYQPLEAHYRLTRRCLELCRDFRNPVRIITKANLIRRDLDVLSELNRVADVSVCMSIAFSDDDDSHRLEPGASPPSQRFRTLAAISAAGIKTSVALAPVIPGLNDNQIPEVLERSAAAGASGAFLSLLSLRDEVEPVFVERLEAAYPDRAAKVLHALEQMRGGRRGDSRFVHRMRGSGPRWRVIEDLFRVHRDRLGLASESLEADTAPHRHTFRRPNPQGSLFPELG